MHAYDRRGIF